MDAERQSYPRVMARRSARVTLHENAVNIFTDGSSYSRPRRGGVGYVIVVVDEKGNEVVHESLSPGFKGATNQEMELKACIEALRDIGGRHSPIDHRAYDKIVIFTDSQYVADNFANAKYRWPNNGWYDRDGNPVVNAALWKDLVREAKRLGKRVEVEWQKGHKSTNPHNATADKLAKKSANLPESQAVSIQRVRRKHTAKATQRGSVRIEGQRVTIRIVTDRLLRLQSMFVYKYEVVSEDSADYGNVDTIYSERNIMLNAGHTYDVQLNDDPKQPRIVHVFGEVAPN
jgi:ribonuclease HI